MLRSVSLMENMTKFADIGAIAWAVGMFLRHYSWVDGREVYIRQIDGWSWY